MRASLGQQALTFAIAAAGVALFAGLALPLPFLFGPSAACLLVALAAAPLREVRPLSSSARTVPVLFPLLGWTAATGSGSQGQGPGGR